MRVLLLFIFLTVNVYAADWEKITIPGAKCGDGKPYSVLLQKRNSRKLYVEFMGGGVCWDYKTCFEKGIFPYLHPFPVFASYSIFTSDRSKLNPFKDHSKIYFPYCTADVHFGDHVSKYKKSTVYHYGKRNIELAFPYLKEQHLIDFSSVDDLVVYGASAGAMASIVYGKYVEGFLNPNIKKTLIADSPGLHFGRTFWDKFDSSMKIDFKTVFNRVGLDVDFSDGAISKKMGPVFENYRDWSFGIILGLRDYVMSKSYGNISPKEEKDLILSPDGIPAIASPYSNINVWLKDTHMHTFLLTKYSAGLISENGDTAYNFASTVYSK